MFGWTLASEVDFPYLEHSEKIAKIAFRFGSVPPEIQDTVTESLCGQGNSKSFILRIENVASFLIQQGVEVIIDPISFCSEDSLRLFLLGPVLGILLHQRHVLPLHASAIFHSGAIVFAGPSGSGKSTLAATFFKRGYSVLADELCAVDISQDPLLLSAPPFLALWEDSLVALGFSSSNLTPVRPSLQKFIKPIAREHTIAPIPIRVGYILETSNRSEIVLEPIEGLRKIEAIACQTYRRTALEPMGLVDDNFEQACKLATSIRIVRVTRPRGTFRVEELADHVERDFTA